MAFWPQKKVIVTGGAGFLGSKIVQKLNSENAIVQIPRSKLVDLVKPDAVWTMFDSFTPDIVIHCAAICGGIGLNQAKPAELFYQNMMMGVNVLHMAHLFKVPKVVTIGTVCSYPKITSIPFKEEDLWSGYPEETNAPYGIAKKSLLVMGQSYRAQYGINVICLVPVNMYGPGDNFKTESSHVIPALIKKFFQARLKGEKEIVCWGTGKPTREFLYVDDAAEAIVISAEKYDKPEPMNLGTGVEISIKDLTHKIARLCGFKGSIRWDTTKPDGQPRRSLNIDRAKKEIGWKATTDFEVGLQREVDWYIRYMGGEP